ncbi:Nucleic acid-binding protein [Corchorus capsularis]|uniref:Nucleic acid-binding protein n=1 Tax=Corchorus capsularis TaxID=210143 RepID=A0A1R3GUQ4_COCAP|nr:Nucleic acid-binding protein [Corchorus capsularis]
MVLTNLSQLHPPAANDAIKLRIARAWDITVPGSERIVGLAFVATDNQGNAIHVQTNESDAEIFRDLVFEGAFEAQLTITLWDRSLDMINVPQLPSMNPKPVMIFAGMLVRIINGRPALTSSFATKLYVNLDIDETAMVQAIYEEMEGNVRLLPPPV